MDTLQYVMYTVYMIHIINDLLKNYFFEYFVRDDRSETNT